MRKDDALTEFIQDQLTMIAALDVPQLDSVVKLYQAMHKREWDAEGKVIFNNIIAIAKLTRELKQRSHHE